MGRTPDEQDPVRVVRQDAHASGIVRIDREALEGAMREDVFRAPAPLLMDRLGIHDGADLARFPHVKAVALSGVFGVFVSRWPDNWR